MRQVLLKIEYFDRSSTCIGRVGEDKATELVIDIASLTSLYPEIRFEAIYQRPDKDSYPLDIIQEENEIRYVVTRKDLYQAGTGLITLTGFVNEQKVISTTGYCFIIPGLLNQEIDSDFDPNAVLPEWMQKVLDAVEELKHFNFGTIYGGDSSGE